MSYGMMGMGGMGMMGMGMGMMVRTADCAPAAAC